jgi:hypothetical protein
MNKDMIGKLYVKLMNDVYDSGMDKFFYSGLFLYPNYVTRGLHATA